MNKRWFYLLYLLVALSCSRTQEDNKVYSDHEDAIKSAFNPTGQPRESGNGALLLTRYKSLSDLEQVLQIQYFKDVSGLPQIIRRKSYVHVTHRSGNKEVESELKTGISEADFVRARDGHLWDRVRLIFKCPYAVIHKNDLVSIEILGRRRYQMFGEGDIAFYDIAERMSQHISDDDTITVSKEELSEKGYINTFNHVMAQAFMTSIFSETVADFIGDVHERYAMPELITGDFSQEQLDNIKDGPVDNYIDMINNEWGQELGKKLRNKYSIRHSTHWTPELLTDYLNDIQNYHSHAFQIGFKPFRTSDELVIRFADKINGVTKGVETLAKYYNQYN